LTSSDSQQHTRNISLECSILTHSYGHNDDECDRTKLTDGVVYEQLPSGRGDGENGGVKHECRVSVDRKDNSRLINKNGIRYWKATGSRHLLDM